MTEITVITLSNNTFEVTVAAQATTTHMVTVQPNYASALLKPQETVANLIKRSFIFLLQREPNTSILRSFDLSVIERYFAEYKTEIKK